MTHRTAFIHQDSAGTWHWTDDERDILDERGTGFASKSAAITDAWASGYSKYTVGTRVRSIRPTDARERERANRFGRHHTVPVTLFRRYAARKFEPLTPDHPAVGVRCALCEERFCPGDELTLVPTRYVNGQMAEIRSAHWECYEEGLGND